MPRHFVGAALYRLVDFFQHRNRQPERQGDGLVFFVTRLFLGFEARGRVRHTLPSLGVFRSSWRHQVFVEGCKQIHSTTAGALASALDVWLMSPLHLVDI